MSRLAAPVILLLGACAAGGPAIAVRDAYGFQPVLGDVAAVYFTVENRGPIADTLLGVEVGGARVAMMHAQVGAGERVQMQPVGTVPVPPETVVVLQPGGMHVMAEGFERPPVAGDTLRMTVRFARAGAVEVRAPVLAYGALRQ